MNTIKKWIGKLQCRLGLCCGHVEHMKDQNGVWWLGLRCTNGVFHDPVRSVYQDKPAPDDGAQVSAEGEGK